MWTVTSGNPETPARLAKGLIILEVGKTRSQYSIGKFSIVQFMSRERAVGLMTGIRAERHGIRITARKTVLLYIQNVRTGTGTNPVSFSAGTGGTLLRILRPGHGIDH